MSKRNRDGWARHFLNVLAYSFVLMLVLKFCNVILNGFASCPCLVHLNLQEIYMVPGSSSHHLDWLMFKDRIQLNSSLFIGYFSYIITFIPLLMLMEVFCRKLKCQINEECINRNHLIRQRKPPLIFWYETFMKLSYELIYKRIL